MRNRVLCLGLAALAIVSPLAAQTQRAPAQTKTLPLRDVVLSVAACKTPGYLSMRRCRWATSYASFRVRWCACSIRASTASCVPVCNCCDAEAKAQAELRTYINNLAAE